MVIDDLHHVEARAPVLRALRAFLDAAPEDVLIVLVSRRLLHVDLGRDLLAGRVGAISEEELAFRPDEVAALLDARGLPGRPDEIAASSGGWAAGIVFDAIRGGPAQAAGGADDPFFAYLGSEVLDALPPDLRAAVLRSALLEVVTPARLATLLGVPSADEAFTAICRHHLPGTVDAEGLRYHPRFREFLLAELRRGEAGDLRALRARYGRALLAEHQPEEAADALLAAGELGEAEDVVLTASSALMRRADWDKVLRWCDALGEATLARRHDLRGVQVRSLLMSRRQDDLEELVRRMRASGEFDRLLVEAPDVAAWAAWGLHVSGDWAGMLALTPPAEATRRARVIRFIAGTALGDDPPPGFAGEELDRTWPLHVALQSAFYYRGEFAAVERLAWAARARGPVTATLAEIYRVAVLRNRGDLSEARAVLEAAEARIRASRFIEFWQQVEAELLFAEGDRERGLRLIRAARVTSRHHGYRLADRAVFARPRRADADAPGAAAGGRGGARRRPGVVRGARPAPVPRVGGHLVRDRPPGPGRRPRRGARAARGRRGGHDARRPAAGAARRAGGACGGLLAAGRRGRARRGRRRRPRRGRGDGHPRPAADGAGNASGGAGAPHRRRARRRPGVAGPDGRRVVGAGRASLEDARLVVRTLGRTAIERDGRPLPAVSPKAVELAAAVARAGPAGVPRGEVAEDLFEGSIDSANYLRQLVHRLRRALPAGVALESADGRLSWVPADAVVAEDGALEALLARSRREVGDARQATIEAALALAAHGPYLPGADGEAAGERRTCWPAGWRSAPRARDRAAGGGAGGARGGVGAGGRGGGAVPARTGGAC